MTRVQTQQVDRSLPVPVILGSALNAYGLVRSFGENGTRSILADAHFGMAAASKYVFQRWRLPSTEPTDASVKALARYASALNQPLMLVPTDEAWVAAIAARRTELEAQFYIPLPSAETSITAISKDRMHSWCVEHDIPVPATSIFVPGRDDWRAFLKAIETNLPIIVKPQTKRSNEADEEIGFSTKVFRDAGDLRRWGRGFGNSGPKSCTICQTFLSGPTTNIVAFHGYRSKDGRVFMAGLTKLRIQPPICGGSTSAAYMRADQGATKAAQNLLEKLNYQGYFDVEFMYDNDQQPYFIELNPRPGLPNYGATAVGVNFAWEGCADQVGKGSARSCIVDQSDRLWIRLFADFFLYVFVYRAMGLGVSPGDWWRSIRHGRWVDPSLNVRDPLVIFASVWHLGLSATRRFRRSITVRASGVARRLRGYSSVPDFQQVPSSVERR